MARKKTILKSQILDTAYEVVKTEGFEGFTARNIAKTMNCSTQPIYLEFKNMDDLKSELYSRIKGFLTETIFKNERSKDPILNTCLNFIYFAKDEPVFFKSLFLEDHLGAKRMYKIAYEAMVDAFDQETKTKELTKDEKRTTFEKIWINVYGTAALLSQNLIEIDEENLTKELKKTITEAMK